MIEVKKTTEPGLNKAIAPMLAEELKRYMPDLVEVVRCQDCRWWYDDGYCNKWDNGPGHPEVWGNDFCSFGERREVTE